MSAGAEPPVTLQPGCSGPRDAWLSPRLQMRFTPVSASEDRTRTARLGGLPSWCDAPTWPLSRSTAEPMTFVGQWPLPGNPVRMAYLFVTDDGRPGEVFPETYDPAAGENALLVQPDGRVPAWLTVTDAATGPSLWRRGPTWNDRTPVELAIDLRRLPQRVEQVLDAEIAEQDSEIRGVLADPLPLSSELPPNSYVGGRPRFWQPTALPMDTNWRFFFQLDGGDGFGPTDPYALNFGGGTGYAFISPDRQEGRFFWDCV